MLILVIVASVLFMAVPIYECFQKDKEDKGYRVRLKDTWNERTGYQTRRLNNSIVLIPSILVLIICAFISASVYPSEVLLSPKKVMFFWLLTVVLAVIRDINLIWGVEDSRIYCAFVSLMVALALSIFWMIIWETVTVELCYTEIQPAKTSVEYRVIAIHGNQYMYESKDGIKVLNPEKTKVYIERVSQQEEPYVEIITTAPQYVDTYAREKTPHKDIKGEHTKKGQTTDYVLHLKVLNDIPEVS